MRSASPHVLPRGSKSGPALHLHEDLPTLMFGRGGNNFKTGRRIVARRETPMCNLFLTMMDRMGVHMEHFGDSNGHLTGLDLG